MAQHITLTPELMKALYDALDMTAPFSRWNLPDSDDMKFKVTRTVKEFGYCAGNGPFTIYMSARLHSTLPIMLATMAHEMIHIRQAMLGDVRGGHGKIFAKLADQVCAVHGFDRNSFG